MIASRVIDAGRTSESCPLGTSYVHWIDSLKDPVGSSSAEAQTGEVISKMDPISMSRLMK
jgi:hypothetical protein